MEHKDNYRLKSILEKIKRRAKQKETGSFDPVLDKNGNADVFIVDKDGNVLFDQFGLTTLGKRALGKE